MVTTTIAKFDLEHRNSSIFQVIDSPTLNVTVAHMLFALDGGLRDPSTS